jgi:hypothetical protein
VQAVKYPDGMNDETHRFYVYQTFIPPDTSEEITSRIPLSYDQFVSVNTQILQRKEKIVFMNERTGLPYSINNTYPIVALYTGTEERSKTIITLDDIEKERAMQDLAGLKKN